MFYCTIVIPKLGSKSFFFISLLKKIVSRFKHLPLLILHVKNALISVIVCIVSRDMYILKQMTG